MNATAKVTSKGQVTIPSDVRKALQIEEGDNLVFNYSNESAVIHVIKQRPLSTFRGALGSKVRHPGKRELRHAISAGFAKRASKQ